MTDINPLGLKWCCSGKFLLAWRESSVAKEPTGAREGIPRAKRAALAGASGVCKRTQTAGEISLDIMDFGEGLV